ncbi:MAG: M48 family metallopeptidase [Cyclobacteriaceae bacterium]
MKALAQGSVLVGVFVIILFAAKQVNWMQFFNVKYNRDNLEKKIGDLIWDTFDQTYDEIKDPLIINPLDSMLRDICESNQINRDGIKLHLVNTDQINAFALPGDHLVIFTGLISSSDEPDEVAGVMAHELAHIELNHVMKKLVKEMGLSVLISMAGGNGGGQVIKEAAQLLSSRAFDRSIEKEADMQAVDYLVGANMGTEPFANFLYKRSQDSNDLINYLTWISTHPNPEERAEYIIEYSTSNNYEAVASLDSALWSDLLEAVKELE